MNTEEVKTTARKKTKKTTGKEKKKRADKIARFRELLAAGKYEFPEELQEKIRKFKETKFSSSSPTEKTNK